MGLSSKMSGGSLLLLIVTCVAIVHSRSVSDLQAKSADSPDCTCLTRTEETVGGLIKGVYSYVDPVGSLIEVTYSMNIDKTNYMEERKVMKNYVNSQATGGLTIQQVVDRVMKDLTPTVIEVVKVTVRGNSEFDLSSSAARGKLVLRILTQLRPVVFQIVTEVLEITSTTYLDAGELTETIMVQLKPIIELGVSEESEKVLNQQLGVQKNNLVLQISTELKPTIISIIKATVAQSDLSNLDGLLEAILKQLRPVVLRACEAGLAASSLNLDANELADEIMIQITPFVSSSLEQEAQKASALSEDQVVQIIITDLKPTVIKVIQATVKSESVDLGDLDLLLKTILRQMRPVVLNAAQTALLTSQVGGNIDANSLADKGILQMTSFVRAALEQEVRGQVENLENQVVKQVTTELRPTVIQVVQATVSSAGIDTSDTRKLLETILVQLRPVVLNEVRNALRTSTYPLDAQSLTIRIIKNLRPFVAEALKNELAKVTQKVSNQVVSQVKTEVQPAVLKVIEGAVGASGVNLNNPQDLVELIISQLRPVVFKSVIKVLQGQSYQTIGGNIDPQKLTIRIIIELTPTITTGVQQQVEVVKKENSGLIKELSDKLGPAIINSIKGLKGDRIPQDLADEIVRVTPPKLQPGIKTKVNNLMREPGNKDLANSVLVDRVLAGSQGDIINAIKAVDRYKVVLNKPGFGDIMQRIMAALRVMIEREIGVFRLNNIPKPTVAPVPTGSLSNIFGTGENFVRVESPDINYNYEFNAPEKRRK